MIPFHWLSCMQFTLMYPWHKAFSQHHKRRANVRISLSFVNFTWAHFWISWGISNVACTFPWILSTLFWSFWLYSVHNVFSALKQCPSDCCWLSRAVYVELHLAFPRTHNLWSPVTNSAVITSIDTVTYSLCATGNSVTGFKTHNPLCMCKKMYYSAVLQ